MNLLAIDTSSKSSVIGIQINDRRWTDVRFSDKSHSRDILPNIAGLLKQANTSLEDLNAIVFGQGPGSFTGLRITVGVVQGLGFGLNIPVVPVSSLAVLAQGEFRLSGATNIMVALKARKEEVYFGSYCIKNGIPQLVGKEMVVEASEVPKQTMGSWVGVGDGWQLRDQLETASGIRVEKIVLDVLPEPQDLLDIGAKEMQSGGGIDALQALPEYLREQVADVPASKVGPAG
jgi:tRNA threonylcarbamoyladenosine biosynthesis protein TsaB